MYTGQYTTERASRAEHAYAAVKRLLLEGAFPLGRRLGEERLAAMIGVSRTPVREALLRLAAEGLVERLPDGGCGPAAPDLTSSRHLYEVRIGLEVLGVRRVAEHAASYDRPALQILRDDWLGYQREQPEPHPGFVLADEDFHVSLAAASGNGALVELLQLVNARIRVVRMHDFLTPERVRHTIEQHLGIVTAALDGDLDAAERNLRAHVGESMAVVEERAAMALARMIHGSGGVPR